MTVEETKKLLITINALYPNWKVENPEATTQAWSWALADYPADGINAALQIFLKTDNAGFAPSVSQLITAMHKPNEVEQLSEGEAWNLVKSAIQDSGYHASEQFEKLPPIIQRCVGSANMLHQWSQADSDEVNTVIMSNFQRTYRAVLSKQEFTDKVPPQLSDMVKNLSQLVSGERYLGIDSND